MIHITKGNIFDADVEALVNPVNCVGVMGKGLALQFKKRYPDNFDCYKAACDIGDIKIGQMLSTRPNKVIINFPTKIHWRDKSKLEYIERGLDGLLKLIDQCGIKSIAIPPLGCGLGGLKWSEVKPLIIEYMEPSVETWIYEP